MKKIAMPYLKGPYRVPVAVDPKLDKELDDLPEDAPLDFSFWVLSNWVNRELSRTDIPEYLPPPVP